MTDRALARLREEARIEQENRCFYCGCEMSPSSSGLDTACTADHRVPRAWGGRTCRRNIVAACDWCNSHKGDGAEARRVRTKHEGNVRFTQADLDRQQRKLKERQQMWKRSCLVK